MSLCAPRDRPAFLHHPIWMCMSMVLVISSCRQQTRPPPPRLVANPHYVLGKPYQADGHWYYPAENYALDTTGIASVMQDEDEDEDSLTADGELRDPQALTAAMQTVQLPAIARVTNLENGRQIMVRVNDRGPASPARIIALSPRAALFLAMKPDGAARVRVQIDDLLSHRLVDQLGGGPKLAIANVAPMAVTAEALPPPGAGPAGAPHLLGAEAPQAAVPLVPDRMPERIQMTYADPGRLFLQCGSFGRYDYANVVAAKLSRLGAVVTRDRQGRDMVYSVQVGPLATIPQADRALAIALRAGVIDAHIVVE